MEEITKIPLNELPKLREQIAVDTVGIYDIFCAMAKRDNEIINNSFVPGNICLNPDDLKKLDQDGRI